MKRPKPKEKQLTTLLQTWLKYRDASWGYVDLAPLDGEEFHGYLTDLNDNGTHDELVFVESKNYWTQRLQNYRDHGDQAGLVLLPVYLERGFEILAEKGVISKNDVNAFRKKLIKWYGRQLQPLLEDSGLSLQKHNPEKIAQRIDLYKDIIAFYIRDNKYTPYFIEAANHIKAMKAKIKLGIPSYRLSYCHDDDTIAGAQRRADEEMDKHVLGSLVGTYAAYLLDNFGEERFLRTQEKIRDALTQASELFKPGQYPK